jgi:hypothetical protein
MAMPRAYRAPAMAMESSASNGSYRCDLPSARDAAVRALIVSDFEPGGRTTASIGLDRTGTRRE